MLNQNSLNHSTTRPPWLTLTCRRSSKSPPKVVTPRPALALKSAITHSPSDPPPRPCPKINHRPLATALKSAIHHPPAPVFKSAIHRPLAPALKSASHCNPSAARRCPEICNPSMSVWRWQHFHSFSQRRTTI